ncbi:PREDICTED: melanoma-associated antigen D4 [Colobus angolensis palliatus]|uniref:melanoma-associated antigen D4 n=1 Tax=Colobus angolensis palliatus TaxID=336983 RepID=UPI0005F3A069|nr:PREDICTED: melanoma-associated antigen D4 [Colobus angolensis palliatus]
MAEGSFSVQSENYSVEDMDEGSDEVREEEMVESNDYEEFGAFGGYGTLTSFDIHILRAFGSLGPGLRILSNEPWELENPVLAQTLVEALQLDPDTLANETAARAANVARAAATKDTPRLSLLLVILGVIFMNGNRASEAVLWEALRKMGLRPGVRHPFLGDLRKLITDDFVKQKNLELREGTPLSMAPSWYLEYKKIPNSNPPEYEFLWGLRARHETSKMRVLRFIAQNQNRDPREWKAHFLEAVDDAFKTMDVDMAEEHARAQMRAQMNIGDEALIGRWSWDDIQVELLTWDEDGDFGDAWARIPFAFWARYHQYILNSNRANRRATWRAGVSSGTNGGASTSVLDGPSTSSTIRTRNAARAGASFFSWIQHR